MKDKTTWLLKWAGTFFLIVGTAVNSFNFYPEGPLLLIAGGCCWTIVAIEWKDRALLLTNAVLTLTGIIGVTYTTLIS